MAVSLKSFKSTSAIPLSKFIVQIYNKGKDITLVHLYQYQLNSKNWLTEYVSIVQCLNKFRYIIILFSHEMNEVVHSTGMGRWPGVLSSRKGKGQNYVYYGLI